MRVETRRQNAYYLTSVGNVHVRLVKFFTVLHCPQETAKVLKVMVFSDSWIHEYGILKYRLIVHFLIHSLCSYYWLLFLLKTISLGRIPKIFNWLLYFSVNFLSDTFYNTGRVNFPKCSSNFLLPCLNPSFYCKTFCHLVSLCVTHYPNPPKNTYLSFLCFYSALPFPLLAIRSWGCGLYITLLLILG